MYYIQLKTKYKYKIINMEKEASSVRAKICDNLYEWGKVFRRQLDTSSLYICMTFSKNRLKQNKTGNPEKFSVSV